MTPRVLLYGATGYSGRLIAEEAARRWGNMASPTRSAQLVLGARNATELGRLCRKLKLEGLELALDNRTTVVRALSGFQLVINAAGPFALTAERLAKSALDARCHYVDITGETDVYRRLDDLGFIAYQRRLVVVCGAGEVSAASDVLVDGALQELKRKGNLNPSEVGAIRIAVPRLEAQSRGSARTAIRWVREQVPVARASSADPKQPYARLQHVPIGQLERSFDFGGKKGRCIASGVALIDVMSAMRTARRREVVARTIEVYMAMNAVERSSYQWAAIASPWLNLPLPLRWSEMLADQLPEGPSPRERERDRHTVLLEIEDARLQTVIDWQLDTPNCYDFTARSVVAVAKRILCATADEIDASLRGWRTPAELLDAQALLEASPNDEMPYPFTDSSLTRRKG
ncbi:saccharopine dehydrogenase NADP-binding domain-containing protein [Variovorax sp. YR216]|uniref:saccharopine dehydrogenase NADP-binding domain-containing protein n=1 Tax=Variovorax sp. YR216 TaxID=1882828 RepID=UPI000894D96B|nr:saccharopine dehydrogenase NADP-binding domain-containing protein [Variovorax sp. YR216]SEB16069.1 Uncharacterized conserved protein [Variovorax sp. YR216]